MVVKFEKRWGLGSYCLYSSAGRTEQSPAIYRSMCTIDWLIYDMNLKLLCLRTWSKNQRPFLHPNMSTLVLAVESIGKTTTGNIWVLGSRVASQYKFSSVTGDYCSLFSIYIVPPHFTPARKIIPLPETIQTVYCQLMQVASN